MSYEIDWFPNYKPQPPTDMTAPWVIEVQAAMLKQGGNPDQFAKCVEHWRRMQVPISVVGMSVLGRPERAAKVAKSAISWLALDAEPGWGVADEH